MSEEPDKLDTADNAGPDSVPEPDALKSLRDRTDELELIISSLTIFALITVPSWLFEALSQTYTHLSVSLAIAGMLATTIVTGISYGLAACFIVHLMVRAYWVGLIGLRTVFPEGIDWNRTPFIGPLTKAHYRETLPDLETATQKADRLASSLFAVISLLTLGTLWLGVVFMIVLVGSGWIGAQFGLTNAALGIATVVLIAVFVGMPLLLWLLDALLARRFQRLRENAVFAAIIRLLGRLYGVVYPQRLVLPVQLTLQSNTRPIMFYIALTLSIVAIVSVGNARLTGWRSFTLSSEFTYLDNNDVISGFRSTFYEDMNGREDRFRGWPRVNSFTQKSGFVSLFLPYQPLRDNLILDGLCAGSDDDENPAICLRRLWSVSINDRVVAMDGFIIAERMDLKMRGLIGLVPMTGLQPGMHRIEITWNPEADEDDIPVDDRYSEARRIFSIPIAFSPDIESTLPEVTANNADVDNAPRDQ
ncbi:MAG: hypothetical protein AAF004_04410 [Pseudomonadota bacterium]